MSILQILFTNIYKNPSNAKYYSKLQAGAADIDISSYFYLLASLTVLYEEFVFH